MAIITATELRDSIRHAYSGRKLSAAAQLIEAERLLPVCRAIVEKYAPDAPEAVGNEAIIRICGYFAEARFGGFIVSNQTKIPLHQVARGGLQKQRRSSACISPWKRRRAGRNLMRWPWQREEHRASLRLMRLVAAIMHAAGGQAVGDHRAIAALETASNLYSSAFAVAAVQTDNPDVEAVLTPAFCCR